MNSIKQIFDLTTKKTKVPVKVGSHLINIQIDQNTTCSTLIQQALNQCKLNKNNYLSYELYERSIGVERVINHSYLIMDLVYQWDSSVKYDLIIRKCVKSNIVIQSMQRNSMIGHKLFEIGKLKAVEYQLQSLQESQDDHIYESVCEFSIDKKTKRYSDFGLKSFNRLLKNEKLVNKKLKKLMKSDNNLAKQLKQFRRLLNDLKSVNTKQNSIDSNQSMDYLTDIKFESTL